MFFNKTHQLHDFLIQLENSPHFIAIYCSRMLKKQFPVENISQDNSVLSYMKKETPRQNKQHL